MSIVAEGMKSIGRVELDERCNFVLYRAVASGVTAWPWRRVARRHQFGRLAHSAGKRASVGDSAYEAQQLSTLSLDRVRSIRRLRRRAPRAGTSYPLAWLPIRPEYFCARRNRSPILAELTPFPAAPGNAPGSLSRDPVP